jgi:hypothetical protein
MALSLSKQKKIMEGKKHTFKLVYRFENQLGRRIDFSKRDKRTGYITYLSKKGELAESPEIDERTEGEILSWSLSQIENVKGSKNTRCFIEKSYYAEEDEDRMADQEQKRNNKVIRLAHSFLKKHPEVLAKDSQGNNVNTNIGNNILFELIEESQIERKESEKNQKLTEGLMIVTDLYNKSKDQFIEFCYAYNVQVKGATMDELYNKVVFKLKLNPFDLERILKDSHYNLISKYRQALEEGIVSFNNGFYEFNFEPIGKEEKECINYFVVNEKPRKLLYGKVGYATPEETAEIAEVGVSSDLKAEPTLKEKKIINTEIYNALKEKDEEQRALLLSNIKEKYTEFDSYVDKKISELNSK